MAAAGAALRLRLLYRMLRVGELLALVAFLSWSTSRVPSAAAAVLRFAGSLLLNARFVFVLGNAIVLLLLALSRHDLSASSSSSGQQASTAATSTTAAAAPPQDAAPAATTASFPSSFDGTPIPPPPPATSLEAFSALPVAPAREVAAPAAAPADAATAFEFDDRPPAARVSKLARAPRRSRSAKMGPRVLQVRRAASPPAAPLELRRSESENGRRRSSVSARDAWGYCWGADDADEFRRTVEAFIDKHKRFHRQESMTMAVVAGSGSGSGGGGHCEAAPAFTGALAVVE